MIKIKLSLDKRRLKNDGTYPLIFKISAKGRSRDLPTGISIKSLYWNEKSRSIKEKEPNYAVIMPQLKELELNYRNKIVAFEKNNTVNDIQNVRRYLLEINDKDDLKNITILKYWKSEIETMIQTNKIGNASISENSLKAISKIKNLDVSFEVINYRFLRDIENEFLSTSTKINTISAYLRSFRAIYNKAINDKVIGLENYPFRAFKIKKERSVPRTLSLNEMKAYFNLSLEKNSYLYKSWLLGKLTFLFIGINFRDLVLLDKNNLRNDRVIYERAKTGRIYSIKLLPEAFEILNEFANTEADTLVDRIRKNQFNQTQKLYNQVKWKNKRFNEHLTKIGELLSCNEKITSYVFRYTWANIAKQLGYSKDLIAESLGHDYGNKVTGIYLMAFDQELIDEINQKIYETINKVH